MQVCDSDTTLDPVATVEMVKVLEVDHKVGGVGGDVKVHMASLFAWVTFRSKNDPLNVHFSSVTQSCPTLCDPINRSTPGLPVHHQLLEFTQTHAHRVGDAIQPSHPLSSPSSPTPNPSQHQGLVHLLHTKFCARYWFWSWRHIRMCFGHTLLCLLLSKLK